MSVELVAEQVTAQLELKNYVVMRGPVSQSRMTQPGPMYTGGANGNLNMTRDQIHHTCVGQIHQDVNDGLEPDAARDYGRKFIAELRGNSFFAALSHEDFKQELRDIGGMILQLSEYKSRLQPSQSLALQNIWEAFYYYHPKEL